MNRQQPDPPLWRRWADEALADVSEGTRGESWPYRYESLIRAWVETGQYDPVPQGLVVSRALFDHMVALRQQVSGWWYWDPAAERKVWHPESRARDHDDGSIDDKSH